MVVCVPDAACWLFVCCLLFQLRAVAPVTQVHSNDAYDFGPKLGNTARNVVARNGSKDINVTAAHLLFSFFNNINATTGNANCSVSQPARCARVQRLAERACHCPKGSQGVALQCATPTPTQIIHTRARARAHAACMHAHTIEVASLARQNKNLQLYLRGAARTLGSGPCLTSTHTRVLCVSLRCFAVLVQGAHCAKLEETGCECKRVPQPPRGFECFPADFSIGEDARRLLNLFRHKLEDATYYQLSFSAWGEVASFRAFCDGSCGECAVMERVDSSCEKEGDPLCGCASGQPLSEKTFQLDVCQQAALDLPHAYFARKPVPDQTARVCVLENQAMAGVDNVSITVVGSRMQGSLAAPLACPWLLLLRGGPWPPSAVVLRSQHESLQKIDRSCMCMHRHLRSAFGRRLSPSASLCRRAHTRTCAQSHMYKG